MGGTVSSSETNNELVDNLKYEKYIKTQLVENILRAVDRGHYYTPFHRDMAYNDVAWKYKNIHISSPCIYTIVLEALELKKGLSFLNLGSGTGYLSTVIGMALGPNGVNHGVEWFPDVVDYAYVKLNGFKNKSDSIDKFDFCEPCFIEGNCLNIPPECTRRYDRIYVGAACPETYETYMKNLLKVGGILVMPSTDYLVKIKRVNTTSWITKVLFPVSYSTLKESNEEQPANDVIVLPDVVPRPLKELCRIKIRQILRHNVEVENPKIKKYKPAKPRPNISRSELRHACSNLLSEYDPIFGYSMTSSSSSSSSDSDFDEILENNFSATFNRRERNNCFHKGGRKHLNCSRHKSISPKDSEATSSESESETESESFYMEQLNDILELEAIPSQPTQLKCEDYFRREKFDSGICVEDEEGEREEEKEQIDERKDKEKCVKTEGSKEARKDERKKAKSKHSSNKKTFVKFDGNTFRKYKTKSTQTKLSKKHEQCKHHRSNDQPSTSKSKENNNSENKHEKNQLGDSKMKHNIVMNTLDGDINRSSNQGTSHDIDELNNTSSHKEVDDMKNYDLDHLSKNLISELKNTLNECENELDDVENMLKRNNDEMADYKRKQKSDENNSDSENDPKDHVKDKCKKVKLYSDNMDEDMKKLVDKSDTVDDINEQMDTEVENSKEERVDGAQELCGIIKKQIDDIQSQTNESNNIDGITKLMNSGEINILKEQVDETEEEDMKEEDYNISILKQEKAKNNGECSKTYENENKKDKSREKLNKNYEIQKENNNFNERVKLDLRKEEKPIKDEEKGLENIEVDEEFLKKQEESKSKVEKDDIIGVEREDPQEFVCTEFKFEQRINVDIDELRKECEKGMIENSGSKISNSCKTKQKKLRKKKLDNNCETENNKEISEDNSSTITYRSLITDKILQLPLPNSVKKYLNFDRDFECD